MAKKSKKRDKVDAQQPIFDEIARDDHGQLMTQAYTNLLIENPDSVLRARGGPDFKVYDELLRDDQVKSCFQQRRAGLTSATWLVEPASEDPQDTSAAEFLQEQLERIGWDAVSDKMLYGLFYGFAVGEAMYRITEENLIGLDSIKVRNRARFRWSTKLELMKMDDIKHPQGLVMPERKFWTYCAGASHDDNPYGQGLAHSLYWPVFFKRNGIKFWLVFLEKFGMPTGTVKLPDGQIDNPTEIAKAKAVLASIQQDSGIVIPDSMTVELLEAARSGTADYSTLEERMNAAISKVILSQTMTTDDGSSLSQAQVHDGVRREVIDSDADILNDSFRCTIGTWLTEWNFPGAKVPHLKRNTEPEEDLSDRAERDGKIYNLGFEPTEDYITETYGEGWVKREAQPIPDQLMNDGTGPMPAEFAELSSVLQRRADHRNDQEALANAAEYLATQYKGMIGKRVEQILAFLEDSEDLDTAKRHLTTLLEEEAPAAAVETVQKAGLMARLAGMLRGQRD